MKGNSPIPPKFAEKLLIWFLKDELAEEVLGDLDEKFYTTLEKKTYYKAKISYWFQVINYLRPFAIKRSNSKYFNSTIMIKNYLFVAFRNIRMHKFHATLNIFSLAIGIAACMAIYLFVKEEKSFDTIHSKSTNLYRLCEVQSFPGTNTQNVALTMPGMGPAFKKDFPEVINYCRYIARSNWLWQKDEQRLKVPTTATVDSTFLKMFDFPLISGDRLTALNEPNEILVTQKTAEKFFNRLDVIGEILEFDGKSYNITGVLENIPETSHLQFDLLTSITRLSRQDSSFNNQWGSNWMVTYLELDNQADLEMMSEKYPEFLVSNSGNEEITDYYQLFLQPFSSVHLGSTDIEHDYDNHRKFNGAYLDIFTLVGIFILIIASVNFMNLTTARASSRAKEVGVRKSVGARKKQLFWQFIVESVLMSIWALVLAMVICSLCLPFLNELVDRQLSIVTIVSSPGMLVYIILIVLGLGIISGMYPAIYLSSFGTVKVLKGIETTEKKSLFRSSLIITQFGLAIAMIVATFVVLDQLNFMRKKDIGFNKDHVLLVDLNSTANEKFELIKQKLNANSNILGVTASGQRLGENFHQWGFQAEVDTGVVNITPSNVYVDYDYLDVYEIELVAGRTFSKEYATDDGLAFIINESLVKELGYKDPIGKRVGHGWYPPDSLGTIIGVTKDFNFNSLHYKVNTLSMVVHTQWNYDEMSIKLNGNNLEAGIRDVEALWAELVPDYPLEYSFLDEHFDELYKADEQMSSVVSIIAILSIIIGAMGLFGLSAISIERRIKEIGIRKVLGAGKGQLIVILSAHFATLILVAFLLAVPITYFSLSDWLNNFAFRINLNAWVFVIAGFATFVIAMLTISYHTLRASSANPIDALRYE